MKFMTNNFNVCVEIKLMDSIKTYLALPINYNTIMDCIKSILSVQTSVWCCLSVTERYTDTRIYEKQQKACLMDDQTDHGPLSWSSLSLASLMSGIRVVFVT